VTGSQGRPDAGGATESDVARTVGALVLTATDLPMDRLNDIEALAAAAVGALDGCVYIADYAQQELAPLRRPAGRGDLGIDTTIHGRVFQTGITHRGEDHVIVALVEGIDRVGVVEFRFGDAAAVPLALVEAVGRALLLVLVSKRRYSDLVLRSRRAQALPTAAEMQWDLLPPLSGQGSGASIAAMLEPAYSTGGDSFDYALNGDLVEFIVIDAVGHGLPAVLKSIAAINTYRNVRREGGGLGAVYGEIGRVMVAEFGHSYYVTGVIGSLRPATGELTWINAGHPEPLLVRDGTAVALPRCAPSLPMGLGGSVREQQTTTLQPDDRLLVYTDGVVERRPDLAAATHLPTLVDLLLRASLDGLAGPETVRRLARSVLESCQGELQDDATLVLVDYQGRPSDEPTVPHGGRSPGAHHR
jgi:phosphoserine phosphatase RsbU/P